jgi:gluconokinase
MFPEKFAATEKWLSFSDYVALKLFGEPVTSLSMASGTGIFDIRKCEWDRELLKFLKINVSNLPPIPANDDQVLSLVKTYAKRWPRLAGAKWFPAIADGAANNIGSGCVTASRAALMVGTSGAMRVVYTGEPPERIPDGLWCYRVDRKRLILGGALSDGGGLYRWLEETLKLPKDAEQVIAGREPGLHGLVFLPFVAGERSTGYHESARGSIIGLTTAADPVDILHAAFESVAFRFAAIFDQMNKVLDVTEIVASGGALRKSAVWTQIIADVLGRDLTMPTADEASSRGAVLLALESVGKIESIEPPTNTGSIFVKCDRVRHQTYQKEFERHSLAYDCLIQSKS